MKNKKWTILATEKQYVLKYHPLVGYKIEDNTKKRESYFINPNEGLELSRLIFYGRRRQNLKVKLSKEMAALLLMACIHWSEKGKRSWKRNSSKRDADLMAWRREQWKKQAEAKLLEEKSRAFYDETEVPDDKEEEEIEMELNQSPVLDRDYKAWEYVNGVDTTVMDINDELKKEEEEGIIVPTAERQDGRYLR